MTKTVINAKKAPAAVGPYVHAVKAGNLVIYFGTDRRFLRRVFWRRHCCPDRAGIKNLGAVLEEAGLSYEDVIKTTVFLDDINDFATVNEIYAKYFIGDAPARSCVEVAALPKGALIEIEVIAAEK